MSPADLLGALAGSSRLECALRRGNSTLFALDADLDGIDQTIGILPALLDYASDNHRTPARTH